MMSRKEALAAYHATSQVEAQICNEAHVAADKVYSETMHEAYTQLPENERVAAMIRADRQRDKAVNAANKIYDAAMLQAHNLLIERLAGNEPVENREIDVNEPLL